MERALSNYPSCCIWREGNLKINWSDFSVDASTNDFSVHASTNDFSIHASTNAETPNTATSRNNFVTKPSTPCVRLPVVSSLWSLELKLQSAFLWWPRPSGHWSWHFSSRSAQEQPPQSVQGVYKSSLVKQFTECTRAASSSSSRSAQEQPPQAVHGVHKSSLHKQFTECTRAASTSSSRSTLKSSQLHATDEYDWIRVRQFNTTGTC